MLIKAKVNPETIKGLNDKQLENLVYNKSVDLYLKKLGNAFKDTDKDMPLYEIFSTFIVDSEVENGGFDQYFLNYLHLVRSSINGLDKIGANKHADLEVRGQSNP